MAENTISEFIGQFGGGFRPNRFKIVGDFGSGANKTLTFHVRSSNLPSSSVSTLVLPYRGRQFKMPGNRTYSPWQMVILDDNEANGIALWGTFHKWSERLNKHQENSTNASLDFTSEMSTWDVYQLDINGKVSKQMKLNYCWPSEVGPISLNMDDNETLCTFPVTLEYSYYTISKYGDT